MYREPFVREEGEDAPREVSVNAAIPGLPASSYATPKCLQHLLHKEGLVGNEGSEMTQDRASTQSEDGDSQRVESTPQSSLDTSSVQESAPSNISTKQLLKEVTRLV